MERIGQEELARGDGAEGRPVLVAYKGQVYDLTRSRLWKDGLHLKTHRAGHDLTLAMKAAPHGPEVLEKRFEPVGGMAERKPVPETVSIRIPSPLVEKILARHPHPISVHFPVALCISAALFTLLGLVFRVESLLTTALCNLALGALAVPVSVSAGLLSWYYNYSGIWTSIYRWKSFLSVVLLLLAVSALIIRLAVLDFADPGGTWYMAYHVLVIATAPVVVGLGYLGGKITFPS